MKVLIDRMVQKNAITGWERRLRLVVKTDSESGKICVKALYD